LLDLAFNLFPVSFDPVPIYFDASKSMSAKEHGAKEHGAKEHG